VISQLRAWHGERLQAMAIIGVRLAVLVIARGLCAIDNKQQFIIC